MEHKDISPRHHQLLTCLSCLPRKILSVYGIDNATEFVLHELCAARCLDLYKAAYFVDNPDFDCCKGVTGFSSDEEYMNGSSHWDDPEAFSHHMLQCAFNKKVRALALPSFIRAQREKKDVLKELISHLNLTNPLYFTWDIKNNNCGILLIEQKAHQDAFDETLQEHFLNGLYLLGFCPIF